MSYGVDPSLPRRMALIGVQDENPATLRKMIGNLKGLTVEKEVKPLWFSGPWKQMYTIRSI